MQITKYGSNDVSHVIYFLTCVLLHFMEAKIDNYTGWIQKSDHLIIVPELEAILKESGFTVLNFMEHRFEPQGFTAIWLLAESHCALHTFPEQRKSYVELSSCNTQMYVNFVNRFNAEYNSTS